MNNNIAIKVENLSKVYKLYNAPFDRMKEALHPFKKKYHHEHFALNNLNFEVEKGDVVGIVGRNGAGKSTLLKIITGVLSPTTGNIKTIGNIAALLELGSGFNPEYTGLENIYFQGNLMGFTKHEVDQKLATILEFADIGDFIYQPFKTYSSGMSARLAFAVAINVEPEILIVDEALSVGDMAFQAKCSLRMKQLKETGVTIFFVSHSLATVKALCNKALYIDKGKLVLYGDVKDVCQLYEKEINQSFTGVKDIISQMDKEDKPVLNLDTVEYSAEINPFFQSNCNVYRAGDGGAEILNVQLFVNQQMTNQVSLGDHVKLRISVRYNRDVLTEGTLGYMVQNMQGVNVFGYNVYNSGTLLPAMQKNDVLIFDFEFANLLAPGEYTVSVGVKAEAVQPVFLDQVQLAADMTVLPIKENYVPGIFFVENNCHLVKVCK
jgi:teichoic acid transport system ATP-binding protein